MLIQAHEEGRPFPVTGTDYPTQDGSGIRDYVHVWDLAAAHIAAIERFEASLACWIRHAPGQRHIWTSSSTPAKRHPCQPHQLVLWPERFTGSRRPARHLAALSESREYVQYERDPPPCDAPPWPQRHGRYPPPPDAASPRQTFPATAPAQHCCLTHGDLPQCHGREHAAPRHPSFRESHVV
ncbi:hypothetical protein ACFRR7_36105 [Streptomyces sp. NPDC056909]|uniref:hypothetical protein n=1 Tax=Streptomyces sp. NPDC056909 TaxID=3345963 RepID=UPI0036B297CD